MSASCRSTSVCANAGRAITADPDQVSAIRAPVLLDGQPVALLAMSWSRRMPEPARGELGVVQRFAEHAAVALAQAQRAQAQQDVSALYRRFQASLSPAVKVEAPFIKVAKTIRKFRDGILAAIRLKINNARAEGLNNHVRLITRRAYGFHSPQAALALVMLSCGPIQLHLPHEQSPD